ncbi:MAG TPA: molybdopterin-dependent oxidoreductase [Micromonosporaceae bacterium]|nr:molybdopterin-dependent oxidoreductase [Micromonosporaceae bacterium]
MTGRSAPTGAVAALTGLGCAELVAAWLDLPSLADGVARAVVDTSSRPVVDLTVRLLGQRDKPATRLAVVAGVAVAGAVAGRGPQRRMAAAAAGAGVLAAALTARRDRRQPVATMGVAALGAGTTVMALHALRRGAAGTGRTTTVASRVTTGTGRTTTGTGRTAGLALVSLAALAAARSIRSRRRARRDALVAERHSPRPRAVAPALVAAAPAFRPAPAPAAATSDGAEHWGAATPLFTPVEDLYVADVSLDPPLLDARQWRLEVTGLVERPRSFDLEELTALGAVDFDALLICVHNPVGGDRLGNLRWTGVPLDRLLRAVQPSPSARTLVTRAVDGFDISLPLALLDELDGYVVTGAAGRPLTAAHGYPARIMVPGIFGQYTGVKWVTGLRLTDRPPIDYWHRRGWPVDPLRVTPMSRIDRPPPSADGAVTVTGVAWAPPHGVASVEVAVDGGAWRPAELADELGPAAWRRWRAHLDLGAGRHVVRCRATAVTGEVQDGRPRPPFPGGAAGYHQVRVVVTGRGRSR